MTTRRGFIVVWALLILAFVRGRLVYGRTMTAAEAQAECDRGPIHFHNCWVKGDGRAMLAPAWGSAITNCAFIGCGIIFPVSR